MSDFKLLVGLLCAAIACLLLNAVKRVYFSPLSRFPGSKLAALTLWNEFYWDVLKRGTFIWKIEEMHKKYGPIVRINPYEIHILDPQFYDELYMMNKLDKYEWWTKLAGADDSTFSTVPHELHRLRRSAIAPFFSVRSVAQLEPLIRSKVEKLSSRFETIAATGEVVRLDAAFMALTMDIICDYSFSRDRRYLDEPDFKLEWKQTLIEAFEGGALARQFPWIQPAMKSLPLWFVKIAVPPLGSFFSWRNLVEQQVQPILDGTDATTAKGEDGPKTVFHALRDSNLPPQEKTLSRFCDEGEILTGAGSETTSQVLTRLAFYLRHVPEVLVKLRQELDVSMMQISGTPSLAELQKLPYLTAVIKEGLRLSYGTTTRLPRICHEDIYYKGYTIPAGTPISQTSYFILVHPEIFPNPTVFRPERWLDQNENRRLDKYLVSFGKGSRQCLGMNLAYAELYITLSTIVTRFDWEMYETTLDDIVCKHDFFVAVGDLNSKGVRARFKIRKS